MSKDYTPEEIASWKEYLRGRIRAQELRVYAARDRFDAAVAKATAKAQKRLDKSESKLRELREFLEDARQEEELLLLQELNAGLADMGVIKSQA